MGTKTATNLISKIVGQSKIGDFSVVVLVEQDVFELEITMRHLVLYK